MGLILMRRLHFCKEEDLVRQLLSRSFDHICLGLLVGRGCGLLQLLLGR